MNLRRVELKPRWSTEKVVFLTVMAILMKLVVIGDQMPEIQKVSSTEFSGRFGQWSFSAQSAPVMVTNKKTGIVLGYFVSAPEFEEYLRVRDLLPKPRYAWEMPDDLAAALARPLSRRRPELDALMDE